MMNGRSGDRRADQAAFVPGGEGVGGVFDDGKAMPGGDGVQLGRQTGDVDGDDGPGARGDGSLDAGGIEIQIANFNRESIVAVQPARGRPRRATAPRKAAAAPP